MHGVMHTLDGQKQRSRPSLAAGDSSYVAHEFSQPEPHSDYGGDDIASHGTIDVPDTPIWHPSDIADEEVVVLEQLPLQSMVVAPSDRSGRRRRVRQLAPNLLSPFIAQPQTRQYAIKMGLKEAAAIVFYGALDPSEEIVAMHDTSLSRGNLASFQGNNWIGNHVNISISPLLCNIFNLIFMYHLVISVSEYCLHINHFFS